MQGEDTRYAVPWKGATRRLTSRGRLGHAKARGRESPVSRAPASNLAIRHRPRSEQRPRGRSRVSARGAGQTNIRTFRRPPWARAGRQASPHRPQASHQAGAGLKNPSPSGRPGLQRPEDPSSTAPGFTRDPGAVGSLEAPEGASTARAGPPLPRRERAALLAERDGGAQARRPSEPATGARPGPEPATAAGPRSPGRDRRPRGAALAWASRPDRSPTDRPRSPAPRRFRVASKRCSNS